MRTITIGLCGILMLGSAGAVTTGKQSGGFRKTR
jgi:hypothetical protein